jgi:nicotinate-nucleotide pyrophosphorylase (carboxylating)
LSGAIEKARTLSPQPGFIEVEVDDLVQLESLLASRSLPDIVLLDNMKPLELTQAVALRDKLAPKVLLEASGGLNLAIVAAVAQAGVDRLAIGALTHSAPALDIGVDIDPLTAPAAGPTRA